MSYLSLTNLQHSCNHAANFINYLTLIYKLAEWLQYDSIMLIMLQLCCINIQHDSIMGVCSIVPSWFQHGFSKLQEIHEYSMVPALVFYFR